MTQPPYQGSGPDTPGSEARPGYYQALSQGTPPALMQAALTTVSLEGAKTSLGYSAQRKLSQPLHDGLVASAPDANNNNR